MADPKDDEKLPKKICNPPIWLSLPSAWDWSLSNAENLRKLVYNVNVIIQYLQDLQTNYEAYTDQKVAELKTYVDAADKALHDYVDQLNADMKEYVDTQDLAYWSRHLEDVQRLQNNIDTLRAYCDENFENIRTKHAQDIAGLYGALQSQYEQLTAYTDRQIDVLQGWTQEQLDALRQEVDEINEDGFRIDNPTTGERDHVGNTVNDVYNALRVHAITCDDFDAWFTYYDNDCDSFRKLFMSALDFDTLSYSIMYDQYIKEVNSPVTGEMVSHAVALEQMKTFDAEQALDCTDRDGLDLTCEQILTKNWSAFEWDTESVGYFNSDSQMIYKTLIGFIRILKNYSWRPASPYPSEPVVGNVTAYPQIAGWHWLLCNYNPVFSINENTSLNMSDIIQPRLNLNESGNPFTHITLTYVVTNENQALITDFKSDVLDLYSTFSEAKGGLIA